MGELASLSDQRAQGSFLHGVELSAGGSLRSWGKDAGYLPAWTARELWSVVTGHFEVEVDLLSGSLGSCVLLDVAVECCT